MQRKALPWCTPPVSKLVLNEVGSLPGDLSSLLPGGFPVSWIKRGSGRRIRDRILPPPQQRGRRRLQGRYVRLAGAGQCGSGLCLSIFLPGLAEAWRLVAGERNLKTYLKDIGETSDTSLASLVSPYPYVIIKSKCAMATNSGVGTPREKKHGCVGRRDGRWT